MADQCALRRVHSATVVWSVATVHHWADVDAGLVEVRRVLSRGGRFFAIERRVRLGATGLASHGWTDQQAVLFADCCRTAGLDDVRIETLNRGRRAVQVVKAVGTAPVAGGTAWCGRPPRSSVAVHKMLSALIPAAT